MKGGIDEIGGKSNVVSEGMEIGSILWELKMYIMGIRKSAAIIFIIL